MLNEHKRAGPQYSNRDICYYYVFSLPTQILPDGVDGLQFYLPDCADKEL